VNIKNILSSLAVAGALIVSPLALAAQSSGSFSPTQVNQLHQIIHNYIVSNPRVLVEASEALQKQEMAKIEKKAETAIVANAKEIFSDPSSPVIGNPKGDVTVVEFYDYQCPHCKEMAPIVSKLIKSDKNLRVVFKELPIFGGNSRQAAMAALAAHDQGVDKYYKFHNALMAAPNPLTPKKIMNIAKSSGLNIDELKKDMKSSKVRDEIEANFKLAQALGIMGTPSFVLGNQKAINGKAGASNSIFIPGATSEQKLQQAIKKLR